MKPQFTDYELNLNGHITLTLILNLKLYENGTRIILGGVAGPDRIWQPYFEWFLM